MRPSGLNLRGTRSRHTGFPPRGHDRVSVLARAGLPEATAALFTVFTVLYADGGATGRRAPGPLVRSGRRLPPGTGSVTGAVRAACSPRPNPDFAYTFWGSVTFFNKIRR